MEIERTAVDSAKRIVELEAQRDQLREENAKLKAREERMKERFDSEESKWREEEDEIRAKCWTTEMEKRKLEIDLKVAMRTTDDGHKLKAAEAKAASLKSLLEERAMEAKKQLKLKDDRILELTQRIKVLEGEKTKLGEEIERISNESEHKLSDMAHRIQVLNLEQREMAEELKRILIDKAENEKINSEHVSRDKLGLEMEIGNKDQATKVLVEKQNVHPVSNVGISGTPTPHNQGFVVKSEKLKVGAKTTSSKRSVKKGRGRAGKDPNRPRRPSSAFFVFMEDFRETFKQKHPRSPENRSVSALSKAGSAEWKKMSEADKAPFYEKAVKRKKEYEKSLTAYYKKQDAEVGSDKSTSEVHDDDEDEDDYEDEEDSDEDDDLQPSEHSNGQELGSEHQRRKVEALGCTVASQGRTKRSKSGLVWTTPEKMC